LETRILRPENKPLVRGEYKISDGETH
jgi:hypothetical protein